MRIAMRPSALLLFIAASAPLFGAEAPDPRSMFDVVPPAATPPMAAPAPAPAQDPNLVDQVPLKNRQRLFGTILASSTDQVLDFNTGNGVLRIPMSQVDQEHLVYGLASRRARIQIDTLPELIAFAAWCEEHGYRTDALTALGRAATMPDANVEVLGKLAHLVDLSAGAEQALPLYRRYQAAGGKDADMLARLAQLEATLQAHNEALAAQGQAPLVIGSGGPVVAVNPPSASASKAGMEAKGWRPEDPQWSLPGSPPRSPRSPRTTAPCRCSPSARQASPRSPPPRTSPRPTRWRCDACSTSRSRTRAMLTFRIRNRGEQTVQISPSRVT